MIESQRVILSTSPAPTVTSTTSPAGAAQDPPRRVSGDGGRHDFDDGGTFLGSWQEGRAHGYGTCTGPKGQGEFAGEWNYGFETSGTYTWPNGHIYAGEWSGGRRHGLGAETHGRWLYHGEWTSGFKGRYGVRQSTVSGARYEGTWVGGMQDGFGVETYADHSTYQGQWMRGQRHGFGVRQSAPFDAASPTRPNIAEVKPGPASPSDQQFHNSLPVLNALSTAERGRSLERGRAGFALTASRSEEGRGGTPVSREGVEQQQQPQRRSRSASIRRTIAEGLSRLGRNKKRHERSVEDVTAPQSPPESGVVTPSGECNRVDPAPPGAEVVETYMGEWRADKRSGFGISQRSDGLRYSGEWYNDKKSGYGATYHPDGRPVEQGKYKDNVIVADTTAASRKFFSIRPSKLRDRVSAAVTQARKAAETAALKADVAASRKTTAKVKAELAEQAALKAGNDAVLAKIEAEKFARTAAAGDVVATALASVVVSNDEQRDVATAGKQKVTASLGRSPKRASVGTVASPPADSNPHSTVATKSAPPPPGGGGMSNPDPGSRTSLSSSRRDRTATESAAAREDFSKNTAAIRPNAVPPDGSTSRTRILADLALLTDRSANAVRIPQQKHSSIHAASSGGGSSSSNIDNNNSISSSNVRSLERQPRRPEVKRRLSRSFEGSAELGGRVPVRAVVEADSNADVRYSHEKFDGARSEREQTGRHRAEAEDQNADWIEVPVLNRRLGNAAAVPLSSFTSAAMRPEAVRPTMTSSQRPVAAEVRRYIDDSSDGSMAEEHSHVTATAAGFDYEINRPSMDRRLAAGTNSRTTRLNNVDDVDAGRSRSCARDATQRNKLHGDVSLNAADHGSTSKPDAAVNHRSGTTSTLANRSAVPPNEDAFSAANISRQISMPSIVHYRSAARKSPGRQQQQEQQAVSDASSRQQQRQSTGRPERPASTLYTFSDRVRHRLVPDDPSDPASSASTVAEHPTGGIELMSLPRRYRLEPAGPPVPRARHSMLNVNEVGRTTASLRGSGRGDGAAVSGLATMRREEVAVLSQLRRDEIRRQKDLDERQVVVLRLDDIRDWCQRHEMLLFFLTLNLTLAALFYRLISTAESHRQPPP